MYLADHARLTPDKPAMVSGDTGQAVSFAELNDRSNRLAQFLYAQGLRRGDHIAVLMENNLAFMEPVWAAFRSGLYITTINRYLPPDEAANIPQAPTSLAAVIDRLEQDHDYLTEGGVFTEDLIETWISYKRENEILPVQIRPHPYEFSLYYDC